MTSGSNTKVTRVVLEGGLTMRTAEAVHARLLELAHLPVAEIDCTGASEIDLSFVQLLLAARASAVQAGRTLTLAQPPSGALLAALERGGFLTKAAGEPTASEAFWRQPTRI